MQVVWRNYVHAMREAGFSAGVGVYVASGLLTYGASKGSPLLAQMNLSTTGVPAVTVTPAQKLRSASGRIVCMHALTS